MAILRKTLKVLFVNFMANKKMKSALKEFLKEFFLWKHKISISILLRLENVLLNKTDKTIWEILEMPIFNDASAVKFCY